MRKGAWRALVPLHVTGLWLPVKGRTALDTGSLGAGLLLEPRVEVVVRPGSGVVFEAPNSSGVPEPVKLVAEEMGSSLDAVRVEVRSPVPISVGYAVSGAAALGTALALAAYLGRGLDEAARAAHAAEVLAGTGLGDVIAQYEARHLEVRKAPGAPGIGRVESYPVDAKHVVTAPLKTMTTAEMHERLGTRLYEVVAPLYARVVEDPCLDTFLEAAREASLKLGFAPKELAKGLDSMISSGVLRGWYVKKGVVVAVPEEDRVQDAVEGVRRVSKVEPMVHEVAAAPASLAPA